MSASSELPPKCQKCLKSAIKNIHNRCDFCRDLEFYEEVLCQLNRITQELEDFKCHAFQPMLKVISSLGNKLPDFPGRPKGFFRRETFLKLLHSEKIKYKKALALQKMERDPNAVIVELKYHFVWNVVHRKPVFGFNKDIFHSVRDIFWGCSELAARFVNLLWLAADHVHIYVESDGEKSVETIVQEIKQYSNNTILQRFIDLKEKLDIEDELWDIAYFSETVG